LAKHFVPAPGSKLEQIRGSVTRRGKTNDYVQTLVDPEHFRGVKVPDAFCRKTATYAAILDFESPMFGAEDGLAGAQLEPIGTFATVFRPSVNAPCLVYSPDQVENSPTGGQSRVGMIVAQQNNSVGLWPLSIDNGPSLNDSASTMAILPGSTVNIKGDWFWEDQNFTVPSFAGTGPGGPFFGFPFCLADASDEPQATFSVCISSNCPADPTNGGTVNGLFVRAVSTLGVTSYVQLTPTMTGNFCTLMALVPVGGVCNSITNSDNTMTDTWLGLPGLGFQLFWNPDFTESGLTGLVDVPLTLNSVSVMSSKLSAQVNPVAPRFRSMEYEDQEILDQMIDRYRVVSASLWAENTASTLQDGGIIGAVSYRGGESPMELGFLNYSTLSQTPEAYTGAFRNGSYSIWRPVNETDILLRQNDNSNIWQYPSIICTGVYQLGIKDGAALNTANFVGALKIRIACNFEYITTSRTATTDFSPVAPWKIAHAAFMLRDFKTSMENPIHVATIRNFLKRAIAWGADATSWINNNKSWLAPAAGAALALI